MSDLSKLFGSMVFSDAVMKERLPLQTYEAMQSAIRESRPLSLEVADRVAACMKEWALEKGATHFTHWFQPMTGITAEKHDCFIDPAGDGEAIMVFSGKDLIRGEPDASSFPSGGLRATFEARGYTAWDPTSPAFIKEGTLCIPTAFCAYGGQALDKKTPLLRSMEALDREGRRILRLFGTEASRVIATVGTEQEYFLIDRKVYERRQDLIYCGRTLLGAAPPKGQELEDHYFGVIKPRVSAFMREVDETLWALGVPAATEHNETAPGQHELALHYTTNNIACDHNQLCMEVLKKVAARHGMVCLLHEKPFARVNGSGKHNNWSLATDRGVNLLEPGKAPAENAQFLLILSAVIAAVDEHQDLLRASVATAGNDHRLGSAEAPPAIISMFVGDDLLAVLEAVEKGRDLTVRSAQDVETGVGVLPHLKKDGTDRNRTSPFAFTGNKFEFRMPGSSLSVAGPNIVLNTIVADTFRRFADELEAAEDLSVALNALIRRTLREHGRILFNGDGYSPAWAEEAARRGLSNLPGTVDALPRMTSPESIRLFGDNSVFTEEELRSRSEILLANYSKILHIEAQTLCRMCEQDVYPAALRYQTELCRALNEKRATGLSLSCDTERRVLEKAAALTDRLYGKLTALKEAVAEGERMSDVPARARFSQVSLLGCMNELRTIADELEILLPAELWPYPSYGELLFSVQ